MGKSTINVVFSIAMLNYQRVDEPNDEAMKWMHNKFTIFAADNSSVGQLNWYPVPSIYGCYVQWMFLSPNGFNMIKYHSTV